MKIVDQYNLVDDVNYESKSPKHNVEAVKAAAGWHIGCIPRVFILYWPCHNNSSESPAVYGAITHNCAVTD